MSFLKNCTCDRLISRRYTFFELILDCWEDNYPLLKGQDLMAFQICL